ncbi:MAG: glutamine synthetase [Rubrivivax sp.]|nr:glutamine synthetase [Rubrivivax sp.]
MTLASRCGLASPAREAALAVLLARLRDERVETLRVAWCDLHGALRGKSLVVGGDPAWLRGPFAEGVGMVSTVLLKDSADRTAFKVFEPGGLDALPGFGAANNLLLLPDPASLQLLPWAPGTAWVRAETFWADGAPVAADPRRVLQRALASLNEAGHGLRCGLELEFHVWRIVGDVPATDLASEAAWPAEPPPLALVHPGYQLLSEAHADAADEVLAIVRRTALGLGLPLRSLEIELGPSQFEAVFAATDALTAADQVVLFRNGVRQALRRAGYHASFCCRPPLPNAVASGWHLHQSLVDRDGRNALLREAAAGDRLDARQVLTDAGVHWLGGLLAHAAGASALAATTIPAYGRFRHSVMAPQAAVWGRDNRGALLRVIGGPGDAATRIENRAGEPAANPYLYIAAQVWSGLDGLRHRLEPGPATGSPYAEGAPPLPGTLTEALDALAADDVLMQGLGPEMATVLTAVRRNELARHAAAEDPAAWERREYLARS